MDIAKWISELKPGELGAYAGAAFGAFITAVVPHLAKLNPMGAFKRKDKELDAFADRDKDEKHAAELWKMQRELDAAERKIELLESHVSVLEEAKGVLELRLTELRVERATGKHKALPPAIPDVTAHAKSDPPRSGTKPLPPLPGLKATRPKEKP